MSSFISPLPTPHSLLSALLRAAVSAHAQSKGTWCRWGGRACSFSKGWAGKARRKKAGRTERGCGEPGREVRESGRAPSCAVAALLQTWRSAPCLSILADLPASRDGLAARLLPVLPKSITGRFRQCGILARPEVSRQQLCSRIVPSLDLQ